VRRAAPSPELVPELAWPTDDTLGGGPITPGARPYLADLLNRGDLGAGTFDRPAGGLVILGDACLRLGSNLAVRVASPLDRVRSAAVRRWNESLQSASMHCPRRRISCDGLI
jgi:hypothetical protein